MQITAQVAQPGRGLPYKWIVACVVILGVFMSILDQTIVNIAIPRLQTAFGADLHSVQWVLTAYILTQGIITPTSAYFSDKLGIKRFYIISLAAFTLGSALCGLAINLPMLIIFRILQGIGGAALFPMSITLLFREFPPQERGMAMGFFGIPALLAPAIGPTLGGYLVTYAGWQFIFYINVPIGIIAIILAVVLLRETEIIPNRTFDVPGFILAAVALGLILYGLSDASTDGWTSLTVMGCLIGGGLALAAFIAFELYLDRQGKQPLLNLRIFGNRIFSTSMFASMLVIFCLFGGLFLLPIYFQALRGQSAFQAGVLLLPQALASMVSVVIGGRLVDRIGVRAVMIPGLIILGIATWQLSHLTYSSPFWWIQVMLILRGVALGLAVQPLNVAALSEIPPRQLSQASSMSTVVRAISSSLGIAALATLVQTQNNVHFANLAQEVTPNSPLGRLLPAFEQIFISHGASMAQAQAYALREIAGLLHRNSYVLAMQDGFALTLIVVVLAIIAVLFVRGTRKIPPVNEPSLSPVIPSQTEDTEASYAEAMIGG